MPRPRENALDKLLDPGRRIGVSPPKSDPLGDHTVRLFEAAERLRPGSATALQARAIVLDASKDATPPTSGDADADAILDGRVDLSIVYCSSRDRYARLLPGAAVVQFPTELQVGPEYAMAILKDARPMTLLLALSILSPDGQRIMAQHGFRPVTLPQD